MLTTLNIIEVVAGIGLSGLIITLAMCVSARMGDEAMEQYLREHPATPTADLPGDAHGDSADSKLNGAASAPVFSSGAPASGPARFVAQLHAGSETGAPGRAV